ncbi:unnamed protein product [Lota lota]
MEWSLGADVQTEDSEGGLRERVLRWFTETQETLILHNGNFPAWFRGFTARKDAEDLLRDKTLGCFLIRLSDKVLGYILSYKGQSRCRHFVINQNNAGLFVLEGDCRSHPSLKELIAHYKFSPIQPYGEYLTYCCSESKPSELYDVVRFETQEKSGVSVQVLKTLWNQMSDKIRGQNNDEKITQKPLQQNTFPDMQPPALPSKTKTRKLTGTVSVDPVSLSQKAPSVPKRGSPVTHTLSNTLSNTSSNYSQIKTTAMDPKRGERARATMPQQPSEVPDGMGRNHLSTESTDRSYNDYLTPYKNHEYSGSSPVENRSLYLPSLDRDTGEDTPMFTLLTSDYAVPQKKVTCDTYSRPIPRNVMKQHGKIDHQSDDHYVLQSNPLYQDCKGLDETLAQHNVKWYDEVPQGHTLNTHYSNVNRYEQIEASPAIQGNLYETLEDIKSEISKFTMGNTNIKGPKFLPKYKKK